MVVKEKNTRELWEKLKRENLTHENRRMPSQRHTSSNKIIEENFLTYGNRDKKKFPRPHYNKNTEYTEKRRYATFKKEVTARWWW